MYVNPACWSTDVYESENSLEYDVHFRILGCIFFLIKNLNENGTLVAQGYLPK